MSEQSNRLDFNSNEPAGDIFAAIYKKVQLVLTQPRVFMRDCRHSSETRNEVFSNYLCYLAVVPALFSLLRGIRYGGVAQGITFGLLAYGSVMAVAYIMPLLLNGLSRRYGGSIDFDDAYKLVGYSLTPACLGSIFMLFPTHTLGILAFVIPIYSFYIFHEALFIMAEVPEEGRKKFALTSMLGAFFLIVFLMSLVTRIVDAA